MPYRRCYQRKLRFLFLFSFLFSKCLAWDARCILLDPRCTCILRSYTYISIHFWVIPWYLCTYWGLTLICICIFGSDLNMHVHIEIRSQYVHIYWGFDICFFWIAHPWTLNIKVPRMHTREKIITLESTSCKPNY